MWLYNVTLNPNLGGGGGVGGGGGLSLTCRSLQIVDETRFLIPDFWLFPCKQKLL